MGFIKEYEPERGLRVSSSTCEIGYYAGRRGNAENGTRQSMKCFMFRLITAAKYKVLPLVAFLSLRRRHLALIKKIFLSIVFVITLKDIFFMASLHILFIY